MPPNSVIAWIALLVSTLSLVVSLLNYRRDAARLKATSYFLTSWGHDSVVIKIDIVNAGRRPIIVSMLSSEATTRTRFWRRKVLTYMNEFIEEEAGLTLTEGQVVSRRLDISDLYIQTGEDVYFTDQIWVIDTLGKRHKIKRIRKNIGKLYEWQQHRRERNIAASGPIL